jgi:hypothetical protein
MQAKATQKTLALAASGKDETLVGGVSNRGRTVHGAERRPGANWAKMEAEEPSSTAKNKRKAGEQTPPLRRSETTSWQQTQTDMARDYDEVDP